MPWDSGNLMLIICDSSFLYLTTFRIIVMRGREERDVIKIWLTSLCPSLSMVSLG